MAHTNPDILELGSYISTTEILDTYLIEKAAKNNLELRDLLIRIASIMNDINLQLNLKVTGYYPLQEFVNSKLLFPDPSLSSTTPETPLYRNGYIILNNFGALPNNATKTVPHGIMMTPSLTFFHFYGAASIPGSNFLPIPNNDIRLSADSTNISITTTADYSAYTHTYIVGEYIKN